jgi:hypothetical protein
VIFVGVDWAEAHHDVCVENSEGSVLAHKRIDDGIAGVAALNALIQPHVEDVVDVVLAIETDNGLLVRAIVAAGYTVYAVNPLALSRYREGQTISRAKSDRGDAKALADLIRMDRGNHRLVTADSEQASSVRVLARAHQSMIWNRTRQGNVLRNALRAYYPAALKAFPDDLTSRQALTVLQKGPSPAEGKALTKVQIASALRRGGRRRNVDSRVAEVWGALRVPQLEASQSMTTAYRVVALSVIRMLLPIVEEVAVLEAELADALNVHPDAAVMASLPGLGVVLSARLLGEFGDAEGRYVSPKARKNYAGTSPITRASGVKKSVSARTRRNRRIVDACQMWAFTALTKSPGARAYYDRQRERGKTHNQALRAVANRFVGILHGCLRHRRPYSEAAAWPHPAAELAA